MKNNNKATAGDGIDVLLAAGGQNHHDQISKIVDEHIAWLGQFARIAMTGGEAKRALPKSRAFVSWYRHAATQLPHEQAVIDRLAVLHDQLHKSAAHTLAAAGDAPVPLTAFDNIITQFNEFIVPLRTFERSFAALAHGTDTQTGFGSRYRIITDLVAEQKRSARSGQPLSIAYGTLDKYDEINTLHGVETCHKALAAAAECILKALRAYDCAYRIGQNSFLLCLKRATPQESAAVIKRLQECLAKEDVRLFGGSMLNFTVSFAVTAVPHDGDVADLLRNTETQLRDACGSHGTGVLLAC